MAFRVSARTILHLGRDLISSDAVAIYELIKNAVDAQSEYVRLDVLVRIRHPEYLVLAEELNEIQENDSAGIVTGATLEQMHSKILRAVDVTAPEIPALRKELKSARTWKDLRLAFESANTLTIHDRGHGMSWQTLRDVYFLIGTPFRRREKSLAGPSRVVLGEKGIGRLSAMRLGDRLRLYTTQSGMRTCSHLDIDWRWFEDDDDDLVEDIPIEPRRTGKKTAVDEQGTRIVISALRSKWDKEKLDNLAAEVLCRLTDPFTPERMYPIRVTYNAEPVAIRSFNKILFDNAHGVVEGEFCPGRHNEWCPACHEQHEPRLTGQIRYPLHKREMTFHLAGEHLHSVTKLTPSALNALGPFDLTVYWYNRRILDALEGIGDRKAVLNLVNSWSGGVMVFRDGFRVMPYGNPDDDWLDIDRKALASQAYKVNRRQLIGRLNITREGNPELVDQTNREGLRDCEEKLGLVSMLKHILEVEFRGFLETVDKEFRAQESIGLDAIRERVLTKEKEVDRSVSLLVEKYPSIKEEKQILSDIRNAANDIKELMNTLEKEAGAAEEGRAQLLHLAGLGLMVEIVAHELNRSTEYALRILGDIQPTELPKTVDDALETLGLQLKTLQKRLRILDPMATAGRQRKIQFDVVRIVRTTLESHKPQLARHYIRDSVDVVPEGGPSSLRIKAVKGMIVQVLENLLDNAIYWLKQKRRRHPSFAPEIRITVDTDRKEIRVWDNGPGVPIERREQVFEPFFTTKPPGQARGLGLFISQEIAKYHNISLRLSDECTRDESRLNTFILSLTEE